MIIRAMMRTKMAVTMADAAKWRQDGDGDDDDDYDEDASDRDID